jgi:gliding motility-associated-like protein
MVFSNFMSPNGDGSNDTFVIKNIEDYPQNKIHIFNSWGDMVFSASPYNNDWDGKNYSSNQLLKDELPEGVYFYRLEYIDNGFVLVYNGKITLKR